MKTPSELRLEIRKAIEEGRQAVARLKEDIRRIREWLVARGINPGEET